ncbi:MAG TPA: hypothetical protein VGL53_08765 [Bryobacteraceae bacterium]
MSMNGEPSYDGVHRAILNPKTNTYMMQHTWLMFDRKEQVRFVNREGSQFKIPYRSIRSMDFNFYNPIEAMKPAKHAAFNVKVGGKRYLTIHYDVGSGPESTILALDPDQYQQVIGSFQSKTGILVSRPNAGYDKHW